MLWLEREVVATLVSPTLDDQKRAEIETYVDDSLRSMPEHLRVGMAAESILFGAWPRSRALGRYDRGSMNASSAGRRAASTRSANTCDCCTRWSCSPSTSSRRRRRDEDTRGQRSTPTCS